MCFSRKKLALLLKIKILKSSKLHKHHEIWLCFEDEYLILLPNMCLTFWHLYIVLDEIPGKQNVWYAFHEILLSYKVVSVLVSLMLITSIKDFWHIILLTIGQSVSEPLSLLDLTYFVTLNLLLLSFIEFSLSTLVPFYKFCFTENSKKSFWTNDFKDK